MTIGFALMISNVEVLRPVGIAVCFLTNALSWSEEEAGRRMGLILLALAAMMLFALATVFNHDSSTAFYRKLQPWLVVALVSCWAFFLVSDYLRWRRQKDTDHAAEQGARVPILISCWKRFDRGERKDYGSL